MVNNKKPQGIVDSIKLKLLEIGTEYVKKNVENSKKEILKYIEKNIERKIKRELKKIINKIISIVLLAIGGLFLLYGTISVISFIFNFPTFVTILIFGLILTSIGIIFWKNN